MEKKPCVVTYDKAPAVVATLIDIVVIQDKACGVVLMRGETHHEASELQHYPFNKIKVFDAQSDAITEADRLNTPAEAVTV
ncbi:hypothetical protein [Gimesia algae]|uniref:Uncharacterized protein n=1 Tax=Gimesia algae TaxID=2527971 RepID=A0A517V835_9PLAN|nr:hypothetical protein [Gimesia algae]QDT89166.1 hypothetical protein Pan161_07920 [Gimesia algae]